MPLLLNPEKPNHVNHLQSYVVYRNLKLKESVSTKLYYAHPRISGTSFLPINQS